MEFSTFRHATSKQGWHSHLSSISTPCSFSFSVSFSSWGILFYKFGASLITGLGWWNHLITISLFTSIFFISFTNVFLFCGSTFTVSESKLSFYGVLSQGLQISSFMAFITNHFNSNKLNSFFSHSIFVSFYIEEFSLFLLFLILLYFKVGTVSFLNLSCYGNTSMKCISFAALIWTYSILKISSFLYGQNTVAAY